MLSLPFTVPSRSQSQSNSGSSPKNSVIRVKETPSHWMLSTTSLLAERGRHGGMSSPTGWPVDAEKKSLVTETSGKRTTCDYEKEKEREGGGGEGGGKGVNIKFIANR